MDILIDFCYTSNIVVEENNVQTLLPAACLLQLAEIQVRRGGGMQGYLDTWIPGYMDNWITGYLGTWIPGYLDTWIPGYLDTSPLARTCAASS